MKKEEMSDFEKLKEALEKGRIVALDKAKDGSIKFGGSFENDSDIIGSKYSPDNCNDAAALPDSVFVTKRPDTWIYQKT